MDNPIHIVLACMGYFTVQKGDKVQGHFAGFLFFLAQYIVFY